MSRLLLGALLLSACSARAGGAMPAARPLAEPPAEARPAGAGVAALARDPFFAGAEPLALAAPAAAAQATRGGEPRVRASDELERVLAARLRAAGRRAPRILLALEYSARVGKSPGEVADALLSADVLQRTLDAEESRTVSEADAPPRRARTISLGLLRRGKGPFRYDFRWTFRAQRLDLPSGEVLVRYDLDPAARAERVSTFQGVAVLEPDGAGTRLTEIVSLGTDVALPFFLLGQAREGVQKILSIRTTRLVRLLE